MGEYLTQKIIKMEKRKRNDERVLNSDNSTAYATILLPRYGFLRTLWTR